MKHQDREKIEEMKKQYNSIPVPEEARQRIRMGIVQAKREEREQKMIRFTKRTGLSAAAALCAITVMANLSPVTANAMENIPVLGTIAEVVTFRTFEDSKDNYEAKIDIPKVSVDGKDGLAVNQSIEEYAARLIEDYEKQVAGDLEGEGHYSVTSTYDVVTDNDAYLSLRINTTVVMASGAGHVKIFTINKATGNVVTLDELFKNKPDYRKVISDHIKEQMTARMAADDSNMYFYNTGETAVEEFNEITGDESFYFNETGELVIVFDEYTVAPGSMGVVEFTIPNSVTGI